MFRALFLDLDGTLVGAGNTVTPRVRRAVDHARRRGVEVVLCTGRSRPATLTVADQLGFRGWAVVSNGAVAMHLGTGEVLCRNLLSVQEGIQAVRLMLAAGMAPYVYEDCVDRDRVLYSPYQPAKVYDPHRYRPWPGLTTLLPFAPACISSYGSEEQLRPVAERLAEELPGCFVDQAGTHEVWGIGVYHRQGGKCNGLRKVIERLGIRQAEVLAIGDHLNDVPMLRFAGLGVAMGNALPEARAAADRVTAPHAEDGVAVAIEEYVLACA